MQSVVKHVPIADARWIGDRLGELSASQIGDAFRAAGFSESDVEAYTRVILQRIAALVRERDVELVVVGLPLSLSGEEGPQALRTREWAGRLAARLHVPVELHDERLTTKQAERTGGSADEDSRAAAHLLEAYLA